MAIIEPKNVMLKNGKQACIRTRKLEDSEKVIKCLQDIFSDDRFFLTTQEEIRGQQSIEKSNERTESFNKHENKLLLIAEVDEQIVSLSDVQCGEKNRNQHVGQIGLSIRKEYRNNGLGTAIMQTMIDWASEHPDIEKLALGVYTANTHAIALYEKMGFIEEGRKVKEIKYADGAYDDCILMYRFVE